MILRHSQFSHGAWLFLLVLGAVEGRTSAQCSTQWLPGPGVPGTSGGVGVSATRMWDPDGSGPMHPVLVVAGAFNMVGTVPVSNIAMYDPVSGIWSPLGSGLQPFGFGNNVTALASLPSGDLVVGGYFTTAGSVSTTNIARWNGTSWSSLGWGADFSVSAFTVLPNGDLVAAGRFVTIGSVVGNGIARWDGANWWQLGAGFSSFNSNTRWVHCLVQLPNGDLVAGGSFDTAGGVPASRIARWNGTAWSDVGGGVNPGGPGNWSVVYALLTLPNGDLVAGGRFATAGGTTANGIARWDGTTWSHLDSGFGGGLSGPTVYSLSTLPNGDLVAGGIFTTAGSVNANCIARWSSSSQSWSALGVGVPGPYAGVASLAPLPTGDLAVGGSFSTAGGVIANNLALLAPTCPAFTAAHGAGCTGSGGPNVLTATTLPWIGTTFHSVATGMPSASLALGVTGLGIVSIPLPSILPQGVVGCALLASPDLLDVYVPLAGSVQTQIVIPNTMALAWLVLHHQVVPIELDVVGNITAITSTNGLTLTIGLF